MSEPIKIALLGCGTVGSEVVKNHHECVVARTVLQ